MSPQLMDSLVNKHHSRSAYSNVTWSGVRRNLLPSESMCSPNEKSHLAVFIQNVTWLVERNRERLKAMGIAEHIADTLQRHIHKVEVARCASCLIRGGGCGSKGRGSFLMTCLWPTFGQHRGALDQRIYSLQRSIKPPVCTEKSA